MSLVSSRQIFDRIPECYKDVVNPEWGLSIRQMEELCATLEAEIAKLESSQIKARTKPLAPDEE